MQISPFSLIYGVVAGMAGRLVPPYAVASERYLFNEIPNVLPDIKDLVTAYYRKELSYNDYINYARQSGFSEEFASMLLQTSRSLLTVGDSIAAWRRGIVSEEVLNDTLKGQQFSDNDINYLKAVSEYFPTPADLVTFAVREVYTPEVVQKYQMLSDLPNQYIQEAAKAGLGEEQAKNYWAAHWQLPSPTQGFEMLHRRVISPDDLQTLLRTLDIMPFWREKLTEISYNPLTRVDVRRMYALGVLDEEGVKNAYRDIGYNETNAELMTRFTVLYETQGATDVTKSSIISAYKKGIITQETAIEYLIDIGYTEDSITLLMATTDYEIAQEEIENNVDELVAQYKLSLLTMSELKAKLEALDLPTSYISKILTELELKKSETVRLPTKSDIERWLKLQLIDEKQYKVYMTNLGYRSEDIIMYLAEIAKEQDTSKIKWLPIATYVRWFKSGIMTQGEFTQTAQKMNIRTGDIEKYIAEVEAM